jgi:protein TonB
MSGEQNLVLEEVYQGGGSAANMAFPSPKVEYSSRVFSEALLENSSTRQRRSPADWAISFVVHFAILILLLFVPLYFSQGIDMKRLETTLLVAPMPPMAPAPPPPVAAAAPRAVHITPKVFTPGQITAPTLIPKAVLTASTEAAPPEEAFNPSMGGVPGGVPGGQIGGITGGMPGVAPPVAPVPTAEKPKGPVRVGGLVKPPRLIFGPPAIYPTLAAQSHVHGVVVIDAVIDEHGNVIQEKVVSGHPLLLQAAMKAVSQRKYEPTILDGEPTPVDLRVEVNFQM